MSCQTNTEAQNMRDREIMFDIEKAQKEMIDASILSESMLQNGGANSKIVHAITAVIYAVIAGGSYSFITVLLDKPDFVTALGKIPKCVPGSLGAVFTDLVSLGSPTTIDCAQRELLIAQTKVTFLFWLKAGMGTTVFASYNYIYELINNMLDTGTCDLFNNVVAPVAPGGSGKKYRKLRQQTKNNNLKSLRNKKLRSRKNKK
jgi:hypothetical protein